MQRTLYAIGVKQHAPSNKPANDTNSFDERPIASTVNLGINSLQTESKTGIHSRKSGGRSPRVTTVKKVELQLARI